MERVVCKQATIFVLKYLLISPKPPLAVFSSCVTEARFTRLLRAAPERASPVPAEFCGQTSEVERRVMIAPSLETTGIARECRLRQGQCLPDDAAARTG
jgi:hypothetical protein